jgi:hypothetical protein
MFSKKLKKGLSGAGIDHNKGHYFVRTTLENRLDELAHVVNTERHSEYKKAEELYSTYMEELTAYLDLKDAVHNN